MELGEHQESVTDDKKYEEDNQGKTIEEVAFEQKNQFQSEKDREIDKNAKKDAIGESPEITEETLRLLTSKDYSAEMILNESAFNILNKVDFTQTSDAIEDILSKNRYEVLSTNHKNINTSEGVTELLSRCCELVSSVCLLTWLFYRSCVAVNMNAALGSIYLQRTGDSYHYRKQGDFLHTQNESIYHHFLPIWSEELHQIASQGSKHTYNVSKETRAPFISDEMESMAPEMSGEDVEILHTIICIDTSGSMRNQIQPMKRIITNYIKDILRRNGRQQSQFELPSIVCFGHKVSAYIPISGIIPSTSSGFVAATNRTKQWVQNNVYDNRRVGYGRTPLPEGLMVCLRHHRDMKARLQLRQHLLQSRVLMFSDGFPTAVTSTMSNVIEEDAATESEIQEIRRVVADNSKDLSVEEIPIYCVLISPTDSNQTILSGMSDITKGNVILPEDVMVLGKYFKQKMLANEMSFSCGGLNWHQVVAYVMLRITSRSFLYYELVAKLICERRNIEICKNRHIAFHHLQRPLRKVLSKWQVKQNGNWEDYPIEVSNRLEEEFQKQRFTGLSSVYIEHSNTRFRIYFDEMKERHIGSHEERDVKRLILGEW